MFKKIFRILKKMWIITFMFLTFTPALLSQCQRVIDRTIE
jgi:hypothetical protein